MEKKQKLKTAKTYHCFKISFQLYTPVSQTRWDPFPSGKIGKKNNPQRKKYRKISYPLENYTELSSPLVRTPKFWKSRSIFAL